MSDQDEQQRPHGTPPPRRPKRDRPRPASSFARANGPQFRKVPGASESSVGKPDASLRDGAAGNSPAKPPAGIPAKPPASPANGEHAANGLKKPLSLPARPPSGPAPRPPSGPAPRPPSGPAPGRPEPPADEPPGERSAYLEEYDDDLPDDDEPPAHLARGGWDRTWMDEPWDDDDAGDDRREYPSDWEDAEDDDRWDSRRRSAWGDRPDDGTMASVAVVVAPYVPLERRARADDLAPSGAPPAARKNSWRQIAAWARSGFNRKWRPDRKAVNLLLVVSILGTLFLSGAGLGLTAYADYEHLNTEAHAGLTLLTTNLFADLGISSKSSKPTGTATPTPATRLSPQQIAAAQYDVNTALADFQDINQRLLHPDLILQVANHIGSIRAKLQSALALSYIAVDACNLAKVFMPVLVSLAGVIRTSPLSSTGTTNATPLISAVDLVNIKTAITNATPIIDDMVRLVETTPSATLLGALSSSEQAKFNKYIKYIPNLEPTLAVVQHFLPVAGTILGVDAPVNYLVMTLDSSEIRPVGGFQGQFAILNINGGHVGPIQLRDVYQIEPVDNQSYPAYYPTSNFMPFYNDWLSRYGWFPYGIALRNSGLSPDFSQSAQYAIDQVEAEAHYYGGRLPTSMSTTTGQPVGFSPAPDHLDGVVMIQSSVIAQAISLTGPITIPAPYNVTVTPQNVTQKIHYYQETNAGRAVGKGVPGTSDATKRFTELLSAALLTKLRAMDKSKLLDLAGMMIQDIHTKDIQMYFASSSVEQALRDYQITSQMYTGPGDSLAINQTNIIGDKIDQFLQLQISDSVAIDKYGTATHHMKLTYAFTIPPIKVTPGSNILTFNDAVYNVIYNAHAVGQAEQFYREYRRIYLSPNAQIIGWDGFDPNGFGNDAYTLTNPTIFAASDPANDVPNRTEVAGYYLYMWNPNPDGTVSWTSPSGTPVVALTWTVPHAVTNGVYTLHVQRQSGMNTTVAITVTPPCGAAPLQDTGALTTDQVLTVSVPKC